MRIISLVPSITELLYNLELQNDVVGITKFCIHPNDWFTTKTRVGGTKNIHIETIHNLNPDLIIANKEENVKEDIEILRSKYKVLLTDVKTIPDAIQMIKDIGSATQTETKAKEISTNIQSAFHQLFEEPFSTKKAIYLIWQKPYMTIGNDTFIHEVMKYAGFENAFGHLTRYPELTLDDISTSDAEYILLSSEPFPFAEKHQEIIQQLFPQKKVLLVDGEMFSWYGSRLLLAPDYIKNLRKKFQG